MMFTMLLAGVAALGLATIVLGLKILANPSAGPVNTPAYAAAEARDRASGGLGGHVPVDHSWNDNNA